MGTGYPDFFREKRREEVAIRPNVIFQSGRKILFDSFDSPILQWDFNGTVGGTAVLTTAHSFLDQGSVVVTTAAVLAATGGIQRWFGLTPTKRIGVSFHFSQQLLPMAYLELEIQYLDGANVRQCSIRYDFTNELWEYWTAGGAYAAIPGGAQSFYRDPDMWCHVKLIIDFTTAQYIQFQCNELNIDMRTLTGQTAAMVVRPVLLVVIRGTNPAAVSKQMWIDGVMVTEED